MFTVYGFLLIEFGSSFKFDAVTWLRGTAANALFPLLNHVKTDESLPILYPDGVGVTDHGIVQYSGEDGIGVTLNGVNEKGISVWDVPADASEHLPSTSKELYVNAVKYASEKPGAARDLVGDRMFCPITDHDKVEMTNIKKFIQETARVLSSINQSDPDVADLYLRQRDVLRLRQWNEKLFKRLTEGRINSLPDFEDLLVIQKMRAFRKVLLLKDEEILLDDSDRETIKKHFEILSQVPRNLYYSRASVEEKSAVEDFKKILRKFTFNLSVSNPELAKVFSDSEALDGVVSEFGAVAAGYPRSIRLFKMDIEDVDNLDQNMSESNTILNTFLHKMNNDGYVTTSESVYKWFINKFYGTMKDLVEFALVLRIFLGSSGLVSETDFENFSDCQGKSYLKMIDSKIDHLSKVYAGILKNFDMSKSVKIQFSRSEIEVLCSKHIPLVMAGTSKLESVGSDMQSAIAYPQLVFGKDVNVLVSPKSENCEFILKWVSENGLQDSITVLTTSFEEGDGFEKVDDLVKNYASLEQIREFASKLQFINCEDVLKKTESRRLLV